MVRKLQSALHITAMVLVKGWLEYVFEHVFDRDAHIL